MFFRYDQPLFGDVSRLIYRMTIGFYTEAAGSSISGAAILAFQTYGDLTHIGKLPWNTKENQYFGQNVKMMNRVELIREVVASYSAEGEFG